MKCFIAEKYMVMMIETHNHKHDCSYLKEEKKINGSTTASFLICSVVLKEKDAR